MKSALSIVEEVSPFTHDALAGLSDQQKWIPTKYLYDKRGTELFEEICSLEDYYPFRAEQEIFKSRAAGIARLVGPNALLIEAGSETSRRVRSLLHALESPAGYVAVDLWPETLLRATGNLQLEFPDLPVFPVQADYAEGVVIPPTVSKLGKRRAIFFPGSAIGNFHPSEAVLILRMMHRLLGYGGVLLVGVDLKKDPRILQRAYDDHEGVTREFNLNLLHRMNQELNANFRLQNFAYQALYNESEGRVEMHLESLVPQIVTVAGQSFRFREGETIHTENAYKYSVEEFTALAAQARFRLEKHWLDSNSLFAVYLFVANL